MNNYVKYGNVLNRVNMSDLTERELDIYMFIVSKINEMQEEEKNILLDYKELKKAFGWEHQNNKFVEEKIIRTCRKLRDIHGELKTGNEYLFFSFAQEIKLNTDICLLEITPNINFNRAVFEQTEGFTAFNFKTYMSLKSKYAKALYQRLSEYKKTGWWQVDIATLRKELDIPEAFDNFRIKTKFINPYIKKIKETEEFHDLKVETIRNGKKLAGYRFAWDVATKETKKTKEITKTKTKNKFNNFKQSKIDDWEEYERAVLSN